MTSSISLNRSGDYTAPADGLSALPPTSMEAFEAVRPQVRELLLKIPSFLSIPDEERAQIAKDTVRVLSYMTDPNGIGAELGGPDDSPGVGVPSYAVMPGDSLSLIAARHGITTNNLLSANPQFDSGKIGSGDSTAGDDGRDPDALKVGEIINLPPNAAISNQTPANRQSPAPVTTNNGAIDTVLPAGGTGFVTYNRENGGADQYGKSAFIQALVSLAQGWSDISDIPISFGDLSRENGIAFPPHKGHRRGTEADIRPFRTDGLNQPTHVHDDAYDATLTRRLIEFIREQYPTATLLFNDSSLITAGLTTEVAGHNDHIHLRINNLPATAQALAQPTTLTAEALKGRNAVQNTKQNLSESPGFAGKDFEAGAVQQGVEQFGEMVQKVDFPKFVGGLIQNVFQAIVESSIEQMRAYGELIANVAKTTDQFMADNIGQGAGRDYMADKYPDVISIGGGGDDDFASGFAEGEEAAPVMQASGDNAAVRLAEISKEMNINPPITDLSDANAEMRLMTAARLEMAQSRQQLLSSMVMLGINRIVVTDGSINAKVVFSMRASDKAKRNYRASMHDEKSNKNTTTAKAKYGSWYTPYSASVGTENVNEHVTTVGSSLDENSESKAEVKAKLSGDVRINFKSDYLPMEKMATPEMMSVIQGNSTPYNPNAPASSEQTTP